MLSFDSITTVIEWMQRYRVQKPQAIFVHVLMQNKIAQINNVLTISS